MKCGFVRDLLSSYAAGLTSEESNRAIERHLESCASCREHLAMLKENPLPEQHAKPRQPVKINSKLLKYPDKMLGIVIALVILGGLAIYCIYMETRFPSYTMVDTGMSEETILEEMPQIAYVPEDEEVVNALLSQEEVVEALEKSSETRETVKLGAYEGLIEPWITEDDWNVGEIGAMDGYFYVDFGNREYRAIYRFPSGDEKELIKTIGCYDLEGNVIAIYYNKQGVITKKVEQRLWFHWLNGAGIFMTNKELISTSSTHENIEYLSMDKMELEDLGTLNFALYDYDSNEVQLCFAANKEDVKQYPTIHGFDGDQVEVIINNEMIHSWSTFKDSTWKKVYINILIQDVEYPETFHFTYKGQTISIIE